MIDPDFIERIIDNPTETLCYQFLKSRLGSRRPSVRPELETFLPLLAGRTLETAIKSASCDMPAEDLTLMENVRDKARLAQNALAQLVSAMEKIRPASEALVWFRYGRPRDDGMIRAADHAGAERDWAALVACTTLIAEIEADCRRRRDTFVQPQNWGDQDKQAFVSIMIDAWWFATGHAPGKSNDPDSNPFLRFVGEAWRDWKGGDNVPDFSSATATLIRRKRRVVRHDGSGNPLAPSWFNVRFLLGADAYRATNPKG
ncbi:hypothetical protein [Bosea sp. PAMC 26642]|uniref:hypothetical protein n=1 Tax=Bosea sp. (strain PAMC 26642) TaxID=1792307 RepID=UPI0007700BED|nr:hypothetical protein [Bosea sp. PAMC 26642]AMJ61968.1 hypothetical protein AXW83_18180 [Bosea sp. PAMC 26642]